MKDFELAVTQQVARVHALEKALHDEGFWSFRAWMKFAHYDWQETDVERDVRPQEGRVVFTGTLWCKNACEVPVELLCGREVISCRTVQLPKGMAEIQWELALPSAVAA
jgi:hypothetical protein